MENLDMAAGRVLNLYNWFQESDVTVWLDGGWCVDALLNFQTRKDDDLDIVLSHDDNLRLRQSLESSGYKEEKRKH